MSNWLVYKAYDNSTYPRVIWDKIVYNIVESCGKVLQSRKIKGLGAVEKTNVGKVHKGTV